MPANGEKLILSLDTASETRSVAVMRGAQLLSLNVGAERNTHSANVLAEIDAALRESGVELKQIELFAAACGPGSFTGLRAGLATLKAFAATLERPAVGVSTLHAVAHAAGLAERVLALIPAGRGEVFAQMLSVAHYGRITELGEATHIAPAALVSKVLADPDTDGPLVWAGSGAHLHAGLILEHAGRARVRWLEESDNVGESFASISEAEKSGSVESAPTHPESARLWRLAPRVTALAAHVAALALAAPRDGRAFDAANLQAIYIRPSDAEINERCRVHEHVTK